MTAATRSASISGALSLGPKISAAESEALDQIRDLWETLNPELRRAMLAELITKLPVA